MTVALCLGGALSVWDDLAAALKIVAGRKFIVVAANHSGIEFDGRLDAWVTLHPELFEQWRTDRAARGGNTDYRAVVHNHARGDAEVHKAGWSGSSGLFAAKVAIQKLDCVGAILCGIPMEAEAGHITAPSEPWGLVERYRPAFEQARLDGDPIRSMSGWSADLFGKPDTAWLDEIGAAWGRRPQRAQRKDPEMRIRMIRTRNFTPPTDRRLTVKYLVDQEYSVKRAWGEEMVRDGDAKKVTEPHRRAA